jgi:tRNA (cmo5U34)-methyltransferase
MDREQIRSNFDQQAATYDQQWAKLSALRECKLLLVAALFGTLPAEARVLCVGAGTGAELQALAERFPDWSFTAVEPAPGMLDACRRRAEAHGFANRCDFHLGYLDTLPEAAPFDAATSFLVSQFLLDRDERIGYFRAIADRLRPGGLLASSDLAADLASPAQQGLLEAWFRTMASADLSAEALQRMREAYRRDVGVLPPTEVVAIIREGGFAAPVQFFQAGLIHGWCAARD